MKKTLKNAVSLVTAAAIMLSTGFSKSELKVQAESVFPTSYVPEPLLNIEDQGGTNLCWVFGAVSAIENNILKNQSKYTSEQLSAMMQDGEIDLHEQALAYYKHNPFPGDTSDPTYFSGGTNIGNTETVYNEGGGSLALAYQLARWSGPVSSANETDYELSTLMGTDPSTEFDRYDSVAHLQNTLVIGREDSELESKVKQAILDYGAVVTGIKTDTNYFNSTSGYRAYYYPNGDTLNMGGGISLHAIAIIGWDDNYSKDNFLEGCQPTNDGAWLCRNSRTGNGYYWMSYESRFDNIKMLENPVAFDMEPTDNYDHNYQYATGEGLASNRQANITSQANTTAVNVFTAESDEVLEAVSFFVDTSAGANATCYIKIFKNFTAFDEVGNAELTAVDLPTPDYETTVQTDKYYTTVEIPPMSLKEGEKYAVCVRTDLNAGYRYVVDYGNNAAGRSYFLIDGNKAIDTFTGSGPATKSIPYGNLTYSGLFGGNFHIRAFTSDIDKYAVTKNNDGTHTLTRTGRFPRTGTEPHENTLVSVDGTNHTESCSLCGYSANVPHIFTYTDNEDGSTHKVNCDCGYTVDAEHGLTYTTTGNSAHTEACAACGYSASKDHTLTYTNKDDAQHSVSCAKECGYTADANHNFAYECNGDGTHTKSCDKECGFTPVTETCIFENGACKFCQAAASGILYIDPTANEAVNYCETYTEFTGGTAILNAGWYYVNGTFNLDSVITAIGDVKLILADGSSITTPSVVVNTGNSLTIYGQTNGTGTLTATGNDAYAGIGSITNTAGGNITINGGTINATGGAGGAGIGGASEQVSGTITINGGNITATGGQSGYYGGAGIGGGANAANGTIVINGGKINATGGPSSFNEGFGASAIGGGTRCTACGSITINNVCELSATATNKAIGTFDGTGTCTVTIADTLTATGVGTGSVTMTGTHKGGTATCTKKANCAACGEEYGTVNSTNHTDIASEWSDNETHHWHICNACGGEVDKGEHQSDSPATTTTPELCATCGYIMSPAIERVTVDVPEADNTTFTYKGSVHTYTLAESEFYTITGNKQTNAGTHTVTVTLKDKENTVWADGTTLDKTFDFVINKGSVTITAASYDIKVGDTLPTYSYDITGLVNNETLPIDVNISCTADGKTAGEFDITVSGDEESANYKYTYKNGKLIVTEKEVPTIKTAEITACVAQNGQIALNWAEVEGAQKYAIYMWTKGGDVKCVGARDVGVTGMYVKGLTNGIKYGFLVRTFNGEKWSAYEAADWAYAIPCDPAKPAISACVATAADKVALNWTPVKGAEKYAIYTYVDGKYKCVGGRAANVTGMYVRNLESGKKYGFLVRAYVNGKWTTYSEADISYATTL